MNLKNDSARLYQYFTDLELLVVWEEFDALEPSLAKNRLRGNIMDEIERRHKTLFDEWVCNDNASNPDGESLRYWFDKYGLLEEK